MAASQGVDLEFCIVEKIQIHNGKIKKFSRVFSSSILKQGEDCVGHIMSFAKGKQVDAWHSDDPSNPFGKAISAKPEPKTDVVLKIGAKIYSVSVKMAGAVQLASGQGSSTAELFEAAAERIPNAQKSKVLKSIIKELRTLPTRLLSESNKQRIIQEAKPKVIDEFIRGNKIINDKSYEFWLKNNKELLMGSLMKFVMQDKEFLKSLIFEATTGQISLKQFKGAVADSIISPKGFYVINDQYINSIIPKIKLDIRGKSRSGITGVAFRIDLKG